MASFRLWRYPLNQFDPKLNSDQLQQCLTKVIRECYQLSASTPQILEEAAEFEAYYLLQNLGMSPVFGLKVIF